MSIKNYTKLIWSKKLTETLFGIFPHRKWNREVRGKVKKGRVAYNKNLITLASSAILLTFTIIQILPNDFDYSILLKISWIFFCISIVCGVLAHAFIIHEDIFWFVGTRNFKDSIKVGDIPKIKRKEVFANLFLSARLANLSYCLELIQIISFLPAVIILVVFLFINF